MKIQPVIMSGGSGSRLWPMSRRAHPKQFLNLASERSLFQDTVLRLNDGAQTFAAPLIIAGRDHGELVAAQLREINIIPADIILEPLPRNTAAVAAVAAAWASQNNPDACVLLTPADHHINDGAEYRRIILGGADAALNGSIVTFGVEPTGAHTGYGYIQAGDAITAGIFNVVAFHEKPDAQTAQSYLDAGQYFWNAGIFLFQARTMLRELETFSPDIAAAASDAFIKHTALGDCILLDENAFAACPSNSIDYAVMEKTGHVAVAAPVSVGWSDIGSWSETTSDDESRHMVVDGAGNLLRSDGPTIGAVGVNDLIIIATGDAVLVARRDRAQDVRALVDELKRRGRQDLL